MQIMLQSGCPSLKSLRPVSTTERHFTLSVVCLIVECINDSIRETEKKHVQIIVGRLGWKWIEWFVLQLLLLKQKEVEQLLISEWIPIVSAYHREECWVLFSSSFIKVKCVGW